jgi:hypothetical protein
MKRKRFFSGSVVFSLLVLCGIGTRLQAVESYPPLVPQGEKIDNIRELDKDIRGTSGVWSLALNMKIHPWK